ncbi:MAG: chorismate lyase [Methylococcales bacterium]|nr:chorismate lyase [Methylococcales bacterium]
MTNNSFLFNSEPLWLENHQGLRHKLPDNVQSWTYESGSLTQRLRSYYGDAIAVKILLQRWHKPFLTERRLLKLPEYQYSLIREVLLYADGKLLILARTIIPAATIKAAKNNLSHLGNRPLGEIIFSYPNLERMTMDITLINPSTWTQPALAEAAIDQPIWGRRTVYAIAHKQLLVSEFFLPEVLGIV